MRHYKEYKLSEWFKLEPLIDSFKQLRNDFRQWIFLRRKPERLTEFLQETEYLKGGNIACVVAFNSPWVVEKQLQMVEKNIDDATFIIFDNSNKSVARKEIEKVCCKYKTHYFPLPKNPEKHPCRSHGIAMSWIYYNFILKIKPKIFAYIDHDLIPVKKFSFNNILKGQPFYGILKYSENWNDKWNLWAGYSFYDFSKIKNYNINFNKDQSCRLDTGGRNWQYLYKNFNIDNFKFADCIDEIVTNPYNKTQRGVSLIDKNWLHIGGLLSKEKAYQNKKSFFEDVFRYIEDPKNNVDCIIEQKK